MSELDDGTAGTEELAAVGVDEPAGSGDAAGVEEPAGPGDAVALAEEEVPGLAEANRRFPLPSREQAAQVLRELSWGEHFVAGRMVPSKGGSDLYLYSLKSAAIFLLDRDQANVGKAADRILKLIDVDGFIGWVRDTLGDAALADAMAEECPDADPYNDRLEGVQRLLALRMVQYAYVAPEEEEEPEEETA